MENISLNGKLAKINKQILINAGLDGICKGVLFRITGIKILKSVTQNITKSRPSHRHKGILKNMIRSLLQIF